MPSAVPFRACAPYDLWSALGRELLKWLGHPVSRLMFSPLLTHGSPYPPAGRPIQPLHSPLKQTHSTHQTLLHMKDQIKWNILKNHTDSAQLDKNFSKIQLNKTYFEWNSTHALSGWQTSVQWDSCILHICFINRCMKSVSECKASVCLEVGAYQVHWCSLVNQLALLMALVRLQLVLHGFWLVQVHHMEFVD